MRAIFVFNIAQRRELQAEEGVFDTASFIAALSSFNAILPSQITLQVTRIADGTSSQPQLHVDTQITGEHSLDRVAANLERITPSEVQAMLSPQMRAQGMRISHVSVRSPEIILIFSPSPPPPQGPTPGQNELVNTDPKSSIVSNVNAGWTLRIKVLRLADAPLLVSFMLTLILPAAWVLWLYRRHLASEQRVQASPLQNLAHPSSELQLRQQGQLSQKKVRSRLEIRRRRAPSARHGTADQGEHSTLAMSSACFSSSVEGLTRNDTISSSATTEDLALATSDGSTLGLGDCVPRSSSPSSEGSTKPASDSPILTYSNRPASPSHAASQLNWPRQELLVEAAHTCSACDPSPTERQDLHYLENYLENEAGSVSSTEDVPTLVTSRSEAVLQRARARARALVNNERQSTHKNAPSLRVVSNQQQWLAAAMGAVHAEEDRAGRPVAVQLDWLTEAVSEMGSFNDSSPEGSPMGTRPSTSSNPKSRAPAMPSPRSGAALSASHHLLEAYVARLEPNGTPPYGMQRADHDREGLGV